MSAENLPSPSAATLRRQYDSDALGKCLVCGADPDLQCDEVVHRESGREAFLGKAALPVVGWAKACSTEDLARHLAGSHASRGPVLHNAGIVARAYLELRRRVDDLEEANAFLRRELCDFAEAVFERVDPGSSEDEGEGSVTLCDAPRARRGKSTAEIPVQTMSEVVAQERQCEQ